MALTFLKDLQLPWLSRSQPDPKSVPADLKMLANGIAFDHTHNQLDYLWFAVEEKDNGRTYRGYRVVRLLELRFIPLDARADSGLLQKMRSVLRSLYGANVSFLHLAAGIFSEPAVGIIQCYGVSAFAGDLERGVGQSANALSALKAAMTAAFRQMKLEPLTSETGSWLFRTLAEVKHALVVVGQPDPRENARGGSQALFRNPLVEGDAVAQQYGLQQNEIVFRGMSNLKEDFLFLVMTSPVALNDISDMLIGLAEHTSTWAAWQNGVRGASFGISLPAILSGALMQSSAQGFGTSEGTAHSEGTAASQGTAQTQGSAHTLGTAHTVGSSHSVSRSEVVADGTALSETNTITEGVSHTDGRAVTNGQSVGSGWSQAHNVSQGHAQTQGTHQSVAASESVVDSVGGTVGGSFLVTVQGNYSHSAGHSLGVSEGQSQARADSMSVGHSAGISGSTATAHSETQNQADTVAHSEAQSAGVTRSQSVSQGVSESWGYQQSTTHSAADTKSQSETLSQTNTVSAADSRLQGSAVSQLVGRGMSAGLAVGVAPSFSLNQTYQWQFDPAILVTQILRTQQRLLELASREGAFYCDAYAFTRTPQGKQAMMGLVPEAFHGTEDVITGVQTRDLTPAEEKYILDHAAVFSPSTRIETIPEVLSGYMDSSLLTLLQVAAYTAPGMYEMGTATTVQESTPDFAFYPNMRGEVELAKQWSSELAEITPMPLHLSLERHFHTAFCGDTGFGKSVSAERLAYETTLKWRYRTIVLDFGQGWRRALNWSGLDGRVDVRQVFPGAQRPLRWNILQVPKRMDPGRYRSLVAELFANAGRMGPRQLGFLRRAITEVYQACGVLPDPQKSEFHCVQNDAEISAVQERRREALLPPVTVQVGTSLDSLSAFDLQALAVERSKQASFAEVVKRLRSAQHSLGRNDQTSRTSLEGLLLRVETFEEGEMARQYGPGADSLPIEDLGLLGPKTDPWGMVVIEGGAEMSDEFAKSAILSLLASVLYFDAVSRRREALSGLNFPPMQIFFEEANKILAGVSTVGAASDQPGASSGGVSEIFQTMWRDGRKYRIFLHLMVQTISELPEGILSSCNNIFVVQTKNARDRDMVMAHIGRSEKGFVNTEYKRYLARIPVKMAVVKLGYSDDVTQLEPILVNPLRVPGDEPDDREIVRRLGKQ